MMSVSVAIWIGVCVLHLLCLTTLGVSRVVSRTQGLFIRPSSPRVERVAVISDPHLAGPEYHLNTETNELDNESVVRSQMRMYLTAQQLVAALGVDPSPKLAVLLGDVVHSGLGILQSDFGIDEHGVQKLFDMDVNGYTIGVDILESIPLPKMFVWGNHDSLLTCGKPKHTMPKDLLEKVYRHYFNASAYSSTELDHWKIIGLNSVWGTTWDPSSPQCNQLLSSFGKKQLKWLDEELTHTKASHVVLILHSPPGTIKLNEIEKGDDDDGITDLRSVLKKHDTIRLVLTGHYHKGIMWGHLFGDAIPVISLPSTRYNAENFFNLDLYENGSWSIVDLDKNRHGARCSDWYVYDEDNPNGKFEAPFRPKDSGNCGRPLVSEESTWEVDPITSLKEYPSNSVFNPEGSCRFMYAPAFFTTCLEDDFLENGCCDVLSKAFWPSSSHPFASCFCQTEFWDSTVEYFASHSRNASSVMQQCAENKRTLSFRLFVFLILTTFGFLSCGAERRPFVAAETPSSSGVERVALIADTHLTGPEYHLNTESNDLDNDSVVRSQMRMYLTARQIMASQGVEPSPKLVAMLGDVVHNGLHILQSDFGIDEQGVQKLFDMDVNGYTIGADIFESIPLPKLYIWGNHDNLLKCNDPENTVPKDLLKKVYRHYFNASAYSSTELDHWKIIGLNSMWGETWDPTSPECNQVLSSFGKKQLMWLDEELSRTNASHVALFFHFPPGTIKLNEIEKGDDGITDLRSVLKKHDTIRLVLTGHFHKGVTWGHLFGDVIPVVTLPSTRYNAENFFNLDLYENGSWSIVDLDKNRHGARCSDWYVYDEDTPNGKFEATFRPKDPGECGYPLVSEESTWEVDPITSLKEYPSDAVFNPEGSCRFMYAPAFFTTCLEDDFLENGCCGIISKAFWPTSSHVFSACLCQSDFWNSTVEYFASQSRNASYIMKQCAEDNKVFLVWPGSTDTWCNNN